MVSRRSGGRAARDEPPYHVIEGVKVPLWVTDLNEWFGGNVQEIAQIADDDRARRIQFTLRRAQAMQDNLPDDLDRLFHIANINTPEGQVVNSITGQAPSHITPSRSNSGWSLIVQDTINPNTGEPFRYPAGMRVNNKGPFGRLSQNQREEKLLRLARYLRTEGFTAYGLTAQGNSNHRELWGVFDPDAPSPMNFDLEAEAGYFIPAADELGENVSDSVAGKHFKRIKMYGFSAEGETVTFSRTRYEDFGQRGTLNFKGIGGATMSDWTVVDNYRVPQWTDSQGKVQEERAVNITDGAGDGRRGKLAQVYRAQTGNDLPQDVHSVQINGVIDDGQGSSKMIKVFMHIIPDREYYEMQERDGFTTDMRISSDSLATQHGNMDAQDWRMIWHRDKKSVWEWRTADGLLALPSAKRYIDLEELAKIHFSHFINDSYHAGFDAEEQTPTFAEEYRKIQPEGPEQQTRVDVGEDAPDVDAQAKSVLEQRFARNRIAIETGSPYASVGALEAVANKERAIIQSMRRKGGGAPGLMVPVLYADQVPKIDLPGEIETRPGMVRLIAERQRTDAGVRYTHRIVWDDEDMANPNHLTQHDGADSDGDSFKAILGEDPATGRTHAYVYRSPVSADGGAVYETHPDDVAMLRRHGYPFVTFKEGMATAGPLVPNKHEFFSSGRGMNPELSEVNSAMLKDIARKISAGTLHSQDSVRFHHRRAVRGGEHLQPGQSCAPCGVG